MLERSSFIQQQAVPTPVPLVPEVRLWLAADVVSLWEAMEAASGGAQLPPPYWAACWPGGQALARYILDRPETVRGKRVLDFAAGSGVEAVAAAKVGAASVLAADIDPVALEALRQNASLNDVTFDVTGEDIVGQDSQWDVVFAGDICYERPTATRVTEWLRRLANSGVLVLMGDPGRVYLPSEGLEPLARYVVPTTKDLEDREQRETTVYRFSTSAGTRTPGSDRP